VGSPPRSGDGGSRYSSSVPGRAGSYEFRRRVWDRVLPTKLRRGAGALHGSAASSVMASNSFSMARTSGSSFAIRHASTKCWSRTESFSLSASARYLERSRAGTRRTNCSARSSGSVKVIFRVAILPYYHTSVRLDATETQSSERSRSYSQPEFTPWQNLFYRTCRRPEGDASNDGDRGPKYL
jgi:hypothetical protein